MFKSILLLINILECGSIEHKYIERFKSRRCPMYQDTERTNYGKSKAKHSSPVEWRNGIRSINWYAWAFATRTCISSLSWRYLNKLHGSRKFRRITRANELFRCRFKWEGSGKDNGNHGVNLILEMERYSVLESCVALYRSIRRISFTMLATISFPEWAWRVFPPSICQTPRTLEFACENLIYEPSDSMEFSFCRG